MACLRNLVGSLHVWSPGRPIWVYDLGLRWAQKACLVRSVRVSSEHSAKARSRSPPTFRAPYWRSFHPTSAPLGIMRAAAALVLRPHPPSPLLVRGHLSAVTLADFAQRPAACPGGRLGRCAGERRSLVHFDAVPALHSCNATPPLWSLVALRSNICTRAHPALEPKVPPFSASLSLSLARGDEAVLAEPLIALSYLSRCGQVRDLAWDSLPPHARCDSAPPAPRADPSSPCKAKTKVWETNLSAKQ